MSLQPEQPIVVERPLLSVRRHGRVLALPVLLLIAVAAAAGYFAGSLPEAWMNWAAGLGALALALVFGVGPIFGWLSNRITITNRRVIVRRGFFVHRRSEIPLSRVREVRSRRGLGQRLCGSGDIELLAGPDAPTLLRDVPGPDAIVNALQELIEQDYLRDARAPGWGIDGQGMQGVQGMQPPVGDTIVLPN